MSDQPPERAIEPFDAKRLRRLVQEGIASGPSIDAEIVFVRLRAKYVAKSGIGFKAI